MAYPTSPTNGQIYGNKKWSSTKGVWETPIINDNGFKNKIINGNLRIDQRNNGGTFSLSAATQGYIADRFKFSIFGSGAISAIAQRISTDYPPDSSNSLKINTNVGMNVSSGDSRLGSMLTYIVEGYDIADLDWGKSTAKKVTLSFWVKANKTGTMSIELENSATTMTYSTTITIIAANTWEKKAITIQGPTSGTWLTDNNIGLAINIGVFTNQSWLYGSTTGAWNSNRYVFNTAQTNFLSSAGDAILFGNFQLEAGDVATELESRPYQVELALCQRYFYKLTPTQSSYPIGFGFLESGTLIYVFSVATPVSMRISATPILFAPGDISLLGPTALQPVQTITPYGNPIVNANVQTFKATVSVTAGNGPTVAYMPAGTVNGFYMNSDF